MPPCYFSRKSDTFGRDPPIGRLRPPQSRPGDPVTGGNPRHGNGQLQMPEPAVGDECESRRRARVPRWCCRRRDPRRRTGRHPRGRTLLDERQAVARPVRFVIANEEVADGGDRNRDRDRNWLFPGAADAPTHEGRLAEAVTEAVGDCGPASCRHARSRLSLTHRRRTKPHRSPSHPTETSSPRSSSAPSAADSGTA